MSNKDRRRRQAQREYIAQLRSMHPDEILARRLDEMEAQIDEEERAAERGRHAAAGSR